MNKRVHSGPGAGSAIAASLVLAGLLACSEGSESDATGAPAEVSATTPGERPAAADSAAAPAGAGPDASAALVGAGATGAAGATDAEGGPVGRIEVGTREHDFGGAIEGEVLTHTFELKNTGEGALRISQAKPTCGCTVGRLVVKSPEGDWIPYEYNDPIPPGTDFELEARLNTRNKKNLAQSKINIFSNDPRGHITLDLKATVTPYFRIDPSNINFGDVALSDELEETFTVAGKGQPFKLELEERPLPGGMTLDLRPESPDAEGRAKSWKVVVKISEGMVEGRIGYPINLLSDQVIEGAPPQADGSPTVYTTTAMVSALVKGMISYNPLYLSFGLVRPGQLQSRTLRIESNDPDFTFPADVETRLAAPGVEDSESPFAQHFSMTVRPSVDGKALDVELTLNGMPEGMNSSFQGKLVVATKHPTKERVEVLFSGVCRGSAATPQITKQPQQSAPQTPADAGGGK